MSPVCIRVSFINMKFSFISLVYPFWGSVYFQSLVLFLTTCVVPHATLFSLFTGRLHGGGGHNPQIGRGGDSSLMKEGAYKKEKLSKFFLNGVA